VFGDVQAMSIDPGPWAAESPALGRLLPASNRSVYLGQARSASRLDRIAPPGAVANVVLVR